MSGKESIFQSIFYEKQVKSKNSLEEFLKEPDEKQIHHLRTSIRRLEAVYSVFPNSCKRKKTDCFVLSYKSLFKKNSSIRDSDVIITRLLENGLAENSDIIKKITKKKKNRLKEAKKDAKAVSGLEFSELKKPDTEKIIQKYNKIVFSLLKNIEDSIPVVISDESKVKELHLLRKTAKKLRYILEIEPNDSYRHMIDSMKSFQTFLGSIHDCDITLDFLKKYSKKYPEVKPIIIHEKEIRNTLYSKLAKSLSTKTEQLG